MAEYQVIPKLSGIKQSFIMLLVSVGQECVQRTVGTTCLRSMSGLQLE